MADEKTIEQKMNDAADAVIHIQKQIVELEKGPDAVVFASMKDAVETAETKFE